MPLYTLTPLSPSAKSIFSSVLCGKTRTPLSLVLQPTLIEFCNTSVLSDLRDDHALGKRLRKLLVLHDLTSFRPGHLVVHAKVHFDDPPSCECEFVIIGNLFLTSLPVVEPLLMFSAYFEGEA